MKKIIAITLLLVVNAYAVETIIITNLNVPYITSEAFEATTGNDRDLVLITDGTTNKTIGLGVFGATLADNLVYKPLSSSRRYYLTEVTTNDAANASLLTNAYAKLKFQRDNVMDEASAINPVLYLEPGEYNFGDNGFLGNSSISIVGSIGGNGLNANLQYDGTPTIDAPAVSFSTTSNIVATISGNNGYFEGISFLGTVKITGEYNKFKNCYFSVAINSDVSILLKKTTFEGCYINGDVAVDDGWLQGKIRRCYFKDTYIAGSPQTANYYISTYDNCSIMGTNAFRAVSYEGLQLRLLNCGRINGENAFGAANGTSPSTVYNIIARNCHFFNTTPNWFPNDGQFLDTSEVQFYNCHGIASNLTNFNVRLVGCTDENGNPLPFQ